MTDLSPSRDELRGLARVVDVPAVVGQFLNEVTFEDVVVEMIQNDLDQGATRTEISFEESQFVAQGNGTPVDEVGWKRLAVVLGAGGSVESKGDGIGTKNHGLRTLFRLGNYIRIRSGGFQTLQAVSSDGVVLDPGCWPRRRVDPHPVETGCRIEVPYRTQAVRPPQEGSDTPTLEVPTRAELRRLFDDFIRQAEWRILGCVAPWNTRSPTYELLVRHHAVTGEHVFACRTLRNAKIGSYHRVCEHRWPEGKVTIRRERAVAFTLPEPPGGRVPWIYRAPRRRVRVELSWPVNRRGKVVAPERGGHRYPLGYPNRTSSSGFTFSAPYISDTARHGQAKARAMFNDPLNAALRERIPSVMRNVALPELGPRAVDLLRANHVVDQELLDACIDADAVPTTGRGRGPFRVPVRWDDPWGHARSIATWIPGHLRQLDPSTPAWLRRRLATTTNERWVVVTEEHLLDLLRPPEEADACPLRSSTAWRRFLKDVPRLRELLDLFGRVPKAARRRWTLDGVHLPDLHGRPTRLRNLRRAEDMPPAIPGTPTPQLLHADLVHHPVLRSGVLAVRAFDESAHAKLVRGHSLTRSQKEAVFQWVLQRGDGLRVDALRHMRAQAIWKTRKGAFVVFEDLREPRQKTVARTMASVLHRPDPGILELQRVRRRAGSPLALQQEVTAADVATWHRQRHEHAHRTGSLGVLEQDMLALSKLKGLRGKIKVLAAAHHTLSAAGRRQLASSLHLRGTANVYGLLPQDAVRPRAPAELMELLGARRSPSAGAIHRALDHNIDPSKFERRLGAFFSSAPTEATVAGLARTPIVPVDGSPARADQLALVALKNRQDPWGAWRRKVDRDRFSPKTQRQLRRLGAVTAKVSEDSSVAFFRWLRSQANEVLQAHLPQVVAHWRSPLGPRRWAQEHPGLSNLPVVVKGQVSLLAANAWHRARLPDDSQLARALVSAGSTLPLVIVRPDLRWHPFRLLKGKVRGLRESAKRMGVASVDGAGARQPACEEVLDQLARRAVRERLQTYLAEVAGADVELRGRGRWLSEVRFREVRRADVLQQRLKVGNHRAVEVGVRHAGVDGVLYLASPAGSELEALFEALAEIMLVGPALPMHAMALGQAIAKARDLQAHIQWAPRVLVQREPDSGWVT